MTKQHTHTMSLVKKNDIKTLARLAAPLVLQKAYDNRELITTGAKMAWNALPSRKKGRGGNGALVAHPQTRAGGIAAPVSYAYPVTGRKPKFQNVNGSVRIKHREYISVVEGVSGQFNTNNGGGPQNDFAVNPLNPFLFPWLVGIAANFDQYIFRSLKLEYIPLAPTTTSGRVALFFDRDSTDPGPDDRSALANYQYLSEISPWAVNRLTTYTDNVKRFMADSPVLDPKLINLGKIGWVTYGTPTLELGDLFVEYTVDLFAAQPTSPILESLAWNAAAGISTRVGLPYFSLETAAAATITYQARVPGTYVITILANVTASGFTPTITGGGVINSSFSLSTGAHAVYVANVTITRNANISLTGLTGATNAQIFATRAVKQNAVTIV